MHAHPQRDFFLVLDVERDDEPVEEARQHQAPARSDEAELGRKRVGLGERRRPQERDQRLPFGAEAGLASEEVLEAGDYLVVRGTLDQVGVVEELVEGRERRVHVGQPQHQQLFEGDLAVGMTLGRAGQVCRRILTVAVDGEGRELLDEVGQRVVEPIRLQPRHQRGHGVGHDLRVHRAAVDLDGVVEDLVDQPHGVELGGVNDPVRIALGVAPVIHALGKCANRREVGKDDVPGRLEECSVELVAAACRLRYVELECHGFSEAAS